MKHSRPEMAVTAIWRENFPPKLKTASIEIWRVSFSHLYKDGTQSQNGDCQLHIEWAITVHSSLFNHIRAWKSKPARRYSNDDERLTGIVHSKLHLNNEKSQPRAIEKLERSHDEFVCYYTSSDHSRTPKSQICWSSQSRPLHLLY